MKKLLLLICALLCLGGSEAWATDYTVHSHSNQPNNGDSSYGNFSTTTNTNDTYTTTSTSGISGFKIIVTNNGGAYLGRAGQTTYYVVIPHSSGDEISNTLTLYAPNGYLITGYSMTACGWNSNRTYTATAANGSTSITVNSSTRQTLSYSGICTSSTPITINANATDNTEYNWFSIYDMTVTLESIESLMTSFMDDSFNSNFNNAGTVGFPKTNSASYVLLKDIKDSINNDGLANSVRFNENMYTRLKSYYNAFLVETNIVMPEDGKVYTFTNVQKNNDKLYIYESEGNLEITDEEPTDGSNEFVCRVVDAKFAFVSKNGYYIAGATHDSKALNNIYDADKQPMSISKYPSTAGSNLETTPAFAFGKVALDIRRITDPSFTGGYIRQTPLLVKNDKTWNAVTAPYLTSTFSSAYQISKVTDYYNKVNLTTNGTDAYASLYLPFSVTIPSGITAYKVTSQNGEYAHMESIVTDGILPKETAAILKKDGQTSNTTVYLSPATGAGEAVAGNLLNGTVAAAEAVPGTGTTYVLGKIGDNIGLYEYTASTLAPGKAYLNVAAGVKALAFDFGDADGIKTMDNGQLKMDNANIFNLAGQRMNKLQRGVNIVNGKKIIVK